jgi:cytochrome c oxidase cbb3-type subunit 3
MTRSLVSLAVVLSLFTSSGCRATRTPAADTTNTAVSSAASSTSTLLVAGDSLRLVEHPDNLPAGFPLGARQISLKNPYEGDKNAIATGAKLFIGYNCLDCHGADGSGAMGPSFQDGRWHFGGSPAEVFESIYQGRPDGMPAWGGRISNDQIWMLTAYVRSLASKDLSTENFTGKTVERTGH